MRALAIASPGALLAQLAVLLAEPSSAAPTWVPQSFHTWAAEYGKKYRTDGEWRMSYENYLSNEAVIKRLQEQEEGTAEYGHTQFSDLLPHQWNALYFGYVMDTERGLRGGLEASGPWIEAPSSVDWQAAGAVTPVKDQQSCGSCWAESAVGNMESMWYLANKETMSSPVSLSTEQIIECDAHDNACYGGYPKGAYTYAIEHGGLASMADYKYRVDGHTICLANQTFNATCGDGTCEDPPLTNSCDLTCSDSKHQPVAKFDSWVALPNDEDHIAAYLAQHGPVSVGIDATGGALGIFFPWLQFYKRGIANPRRCTTTIDHAVLLVGYGTDAGQMYWIVKNSWGTKWGESGYFRLVRGQGRCGVNLMATSVVVGDGSLSQQARSLSVPAPKASASKVKVTLMTESGCPHCRDAIIGPLQDMVAAVGVADIIDLNNIPFGNNYYATKECGSGPYDPKERHCWCKTCVETDSPADDCFSGAIVPQHGLLEIQVNTMEACAKSLSRSWQQYWPFLVCMERRYPQEGVSAAPTCAAAATIDRAALQKCYEGPEGLDLLKKEARASTDHEGVPYILVEGKEVAGSQALDAVCQAFTGPKPAGCIANIYT